MKINRKSNEYIKFSVLIKILLFRTRPLSYLSIECISTSGTDVSISPYQIHYVIINSTTKALFFIGIIDPQQIKGLISEPKILLKHKMIAHESKQQIGIIICGEACLWTINYTQYTQLRCGNGNTTTPLSLSLSLSLYFIAPLFKILSFHSRIQVVCYQQYDILKESRFTVN